ncbi:hypothetical protein WISP_36323 [Willisornis vidua]|uniref:Uncharacterized protein n=1 Tax=Willisornis vidua TaxID=1566151 RepID=A0ABQ9DPQ1_9PASS|nr:hypothetical protein WISP_36323 [Willisornis vidua]
MVPLPWHCRGHIWIVVLTLYLQRREVVVVAHMSQGERDQQRNGQNTRTGATDVWTETKGTGLVELGRDERGGEKGMQLLSPPPAGGSGKDEAKLWNEVVEGGIECIVSRFVDDIELRGMVGRVGIQRDLDSLERGVHANLMKFNRGKCHGQGNPKHGYRPGQEWIENSPEENDLEALTVEIVNMSLEHTLAAQKANCVLG